MMLNDYYKQAKYMLDIKDVCKFYGVVFNRAGFACCPFHSEKTASFKIKDRYFAHCFGCGISVDVISFTAKLFGLNNYDALIKLNNDFSLSLPINRKKEIRDFSSRQDKIKSELNQKKEDLEKLKKKKAQINELLDFESYFDKIIMTKKPKNPDEYPCEEFLFALNEKEYVSYLINSLSDNLIRK